MKEAHQKHSANLQTDGFQGHAATTRKLLYAGKASGKKEIANECKKTSLSCGQAEQQYPDSRCY